MNVEMHAALGGGVVVDDDGGGGCHCFGHNSYCVGCNVVLNVISSGSSGD